MAMGDAENDLSMLEYAYHSVAMAKRQPGSSKSMRLSDIEQR